MASTSALVSRPSFKNARAKSWKTIETAKTPATEAAVIASIPKIDAPPIVPKASSTKTAIMRRKISLAKE